MKSDSEALINRLGWGVRGIAAMWHCIAGVLILPILTPLMRLTPWEMTIFTWLVIPLGLIGILVLVPSRERRLRTLRIFLQKHFAGEATEEDYRSGFDAIANLPRSETILGVSIWLGLAPPIVLTTWILSDTFSVSMGAIIGVAAAAAGFLSQLFSFSALKKFVEPYRAIAAEGLHDPKVRQDLTKSFTLSVKLPLVIASLLVTVTFFSVVYTQSRILRSMETRETSVQRALLEEAQHEAQQVLAGEAAEIASRPVQTYFGEGKFLIVQRETGEIVAGDRSAVVKGEIEALLATLAKTREQGVTAGDSSIFDVPHTFAWQELPDQQHVLVVVTQEDARVADGSKNMIAYIAFVSILAVGVGLAAANRLTADLRHSLDLLSAQVSRVAAGDLRRGKTLESEDELGRLAHGVEQMASALRQTVSGVVASADRVDLAAGEIAEVTDAVAMASREQTEGVLHVTTAMDSINQQVEGIHVSAEELNASVEQSSSSVMELGAMGEQLADSGTVLISKVTQASQTFKKFLEEIGRVTDSTALLSQGTFETSSGIKQMAVALSQVDENATATAKLSERVVQNTEVGKLSIEKTIRSMSSIQEDSELAVKLVKELDVQTEQIGSIVGVIANVADETNLLALNAAIIAAQAGEHGRAFSVVADEIKDLADRVLTSAAEITKVIQTLQQGTNRMVTAIDRSASNVRAGVDLSRESGASLEAINRAALETGTRMMEVVRAVQEQSAAAEEVTRLMESMQDSVTHIQRAAELQLQKTQEMVASNESMHDAATQVQVASEEQGHSASEIANTIEHVRSATGDIVKSLHQQSGSMQEVTRRVAVVQEKTQSNEAATKRMTQSMQSLIEEAMRLREGVDRFKV